MCAVCGADPDVSPLVSEKELKTDGRKAFPLCRACHNKDVKHVLHGKADQVAAGAEKRTERASNKTAAAAKKPAAPDKKRPRAAGAKAAKKAAAKKAAQKRSTLSDKESSSSDDAPIGRRYTRPRATTQVLDKVSDID